MGGPLTPYFLEKTLKRCLNIFKVYKTFKKVLKTFFKKNVKKKLVGGNYGGAPNPVFSGKSDAR